MYKFIDSMHQEYENYYGYIYIILDQKYNKVYVGQKKGRIGDSKGYYGSGTLITRIQKSRGIYFLKKIILGTCYSKEDLNLYEINCIDFFFSNMFIYGYNIAKGGTGGDTISHHPNKKDIAKRVKKTRGSFAHSKSTKQKMKDSWTDERRKKYSITCEGKTLSEDHKKNISIGLTGYIKTESHRNNISKAKIGIKLTQEHKDKLKGREISEETRKLLIIANSGENNSMFGKTHSENTKQKMKNASKLLPLKVCPYCGKECNLGNAKRWHFDNCKNIFDEEINESKHS